ncbi:MAG: hypothetical protein HKN43_06645 [Rhodothermales bacterium]|nr:hypothetical protein [Rhodothermales bacterium]
MTKHLPIVIAWSILLLVFLPVQTGNAQVVDSTEIAIDSLRVDSTMIVPNPDTSDVAAAAQPGLLRQSRRSGGQDPDITIYPPVSNALEMVEQISRIPGSFSYDLSTPGWPSFWTIRGRNPAAIGVSWDGFNFDELYTGRPAFELLPRGLLDTLQLDVGTASSPTIRTVTRRSTSGAPLTELAYRTSNKGMQYVYASHSQQRNRTILGRPGRIGIRAGYEGQKADGEYPGSKLERARGVFTSLDLQSGRLGFELSNLASRRRVGAHGGVIAPVPGDPNSIYQRFGALVFDQNAERRIIRNDVTATTVFDANEEVSISLSTRWTKQFFRYRNSSDTLQVRSRRSLVRLDTWYKKRALLVGGHVSASNEWIADHSFLTGSLQDLSRYSAWLSFARAGTFSVSLKGGANSFDGNESHSIALRAGVITDFVGLEIAGSRSVPDPAHLDTFGFGRFATVAARTPGYVTDSRVRLEIELRPFSLSITPFILLEENPRDWMNTAVADSIVYRASGRDRTTSGISAKAGFRLQASRGFYASFDATSLSRVFVGSDPVSNPLASWESVGPDRYATAIAGLKYVLFEGDLDGNFYLRSRMWPDFTGYALHRQTGLAVLPTVGSTEIVSKSATLDVIVEAGVRGATIFLSYENVLSGTNLVIGNQLVAGYPLAQRRLRFGVFWPILN